jgi:hypothetical protein
VANAHAWGTLYLTFSDGAYAWSALNLALSAVREGIASLFCW